MNPRLAVYKTATLPLSYFGLIYGNYTILVVRGNNWVFRIKEEKIEKPRLAEGEKRFPRKTPGGRAQSVAHGQLTIRPNPKSFEFVEENYLPPVLQVRAIFRLAQRISAVKRGGLQFSKRFGPGRAEAGPKQ